MEEPIVHVRRHPWIETSDRQWWRLRPEDVPGVLSKTTSGPLTVYPAGRAANSVFFGMTEQIESSEIAEIIYWNDPAKAENPEIDNILQILREQCLTPSGQMLSGRKLATKLYELGFRPKEV